MTMVITKRTKLSLSQLLDLFNPNVVHVILDKYDISCRGYRQIEVSRALSDANQLSIGGFVEEIIETRGDLRNRVTPRYRFDERWQDLEKCLLLDGYRIEGNSITKVDPVIEGGEPIEDNLTYEIEHSCLPTSTEIKSHITLSADAFRKAAPDYNGCLSHARIALETLVRSIAENKGFQINTASKGWGSSLSYLQANGFITKKEEVALSSAYTFISEGSHVPVGFTEEEFVRFGRNLVTSMCYFVIKIFNGGNNA